MAYTKQTWENGNIITASKLNHMEDGISSAFFPFVVNVETNNDDSMTADKTYAEVSAAYENGDYPLYILRGNGGSAMSTSIQVLEGKFIVVIPYGINADSNVIATEYCHDATGFYEPD